MQKKSQSPQEHLQLTSLPLLLCICGISLGAAFFFVDAWISSAKAPFTTPRWSFLVPSLIGAFVLWQGFLVRAYQANQRILNPLRAGRIWLLTQSASRVGAILLGLTLGVVVSYANFGVTAFLNEQILNFSLASFGAFFLSVAGWIAERWCVIDSDDDENEAKKAKRTKSERQSGAQPA